VRHFHPYAPWCLVDEFEDCLAWMVVSFASCSVLNGTVRGLLFLTKRVVHLAAFETRMQILAGVCGGWEILSAVRAKKSQ
jgi:hypothetical protein